MTQEFVRQTDERTGSLYDSKCRALLRFFARPIKLNSTCNANMMSYRHCEIHWHCLDIGMAWTANHLFQQKINLTDYQHLTRLQIIYQDQDRKNVLFGSWSVSRARLVSGEQNRGLAEWKNSCVQPTACSIRGHRTAKRTMSIGYYRSLSDAFGRFTANGQRSREMSVCTTPKDIANNGGWLWSTCCSGGKSSAFM